MRFRVLCLAVSILCLVPFAQAQEAALSGAVHDATGAVIPSATVKLTSRERGITQTAQTNQAGVYQFSFLPAGGYDLEVSASGFKTTTRTGVTLAVAQNARIDFSLDIGNVSENVTVEANTGAVNTESADLGAVVDNTRVVEMPLNGRQFWSLAELAPGVMPPTQNSSLGYRGGFNVAGSCEGCNNHTLNGFNNNDPTVQVPSFRPSIDSIQEFTVLTGVYPAQYGFGTGGQAIIVTKSGTNGIHGTLYDFLRNQVMDARNFFTPVGPTPSFKQNQFGGTVGGPIIKNRTFFFYSYEGLRLRQQVSTLTTVPTLAMDQGDFSAIGKIITDPTTGNPFPGNKIPANRLNAEGLALMSYYPAPTYATPLGGVPTNNYLLAETRPENYNNSSLRLDHTFSPKDTMFATGNYFNDVSFEPSNSTCGSATIPGFGCNAFLRAQIYGIGETHVFSPSMVNDFRVGAQILVQPRIAQDAAINFNGQFGISPLSNIPPANLPAASLGSFWTGAPRFPDLGLPYTTVSGFAFLGTPTNLPQRRADITREINDSFSWTHGKHTIKIGGDLSHFATDNILVSTATGSYTFTNTSQGPTSKYGIADVLLGLPASTANSPYQYKYYVRVSYISAYLQDDYKILPNLTLNIGIRWELDTPPLDEWHLLTNFDPAKGIPVTQGTDGFGEHVTRFDWHDFGPRFGFAWQPFHDGKTVIRGGGGGFFNNLNANTLSGLYEGVPYKINNTYTSSLTQPIALPNPFPTTDAVISNSPSGADANYRLARVYEWSLGVQRQIAKDMLVEATYFGSSGSHLALTQNINQPLPGPGTPAQVNARRPYPQYGTIGYTEWDGSSHFNSLMARVQKQYGYGLSFLASYTYSKSMDDLGTPTNQYDFTTARGLSSFDIRHRFVISPVYELPFGKNKPYLSTGLASKIAGGWQLSSLFQWNTGTPLTATLSGNFSNSGGTTDRPNLTGNPNSGAPNTPAEWFNTSVFQVPLASGVAGAPYSFGNEGRSVITGPGLVSMDLSLVRMFRIGEWGKLQFRFESFDALNHPNFGLPALVANVPGFGTITSSQSQRQNQGALKFVF